MKISDMSVDRITLDNKDLLTRILFRGIEDDGENGDVIFVLAVCRPVNIGFHMQLNYIILDVPQRY
ncbi:hypothetical protein PUW24_14470 [Paenibacillus urinalis]|uniref:Uncharacterized protein n=1 Tax=Paenibacillus urinalis TaxID=521520 RepID=A0ABY7XGS6_9BACL|nr:hypothetical protein [Paenibacillus urinalis]WDI00114.1 hypothetical protein PUW24_14470 [Paenibacillus urinalis]WDI05011.1 hypothetical protein PUW25_06595 [Paenibacillus urinalis]